jgi:hypothetical protein
MTSHGAKAASWKRSIAREKVRPMLTKSSPSKEEEKIPPLFYSEKGGKCGESGPVSTSWEKEQIWGNLGVRWLGIGDC